MFLTAAATTETCITGYACKINSDGKINNYQNKDKSENFSGDIKPDKQKKKEANKKDSSKNKILTDEIKSEIGK